MGILTSAADPERWWYNFGQGASCLLKICVSMSSSHLNDINTLLRLVSTIYLVAQHGIVYLLCRDGHHKILASLTIYFIIPFSFEWKVQSVRKLADSTTWLSNTLKKAFCTKHRMMNIFLPSEQFYSWTHIQRVHAAPKQSAPEISEKTGFRAISFKKPEVYQFYWALKLFIFTSQSRHLHLLHNTALSSP